MKIKNTLLRIISLVLIITMLLPTNVYAAPNESGSGNGTDDNSNIGSSDNKEAGRIYGTYNRTGWLIYLAKKPAKEGGKVTLASDVVFASATGEFPSGYNTSYLISRIGHKKAKLYHEVNGEKKKYETAKWGTPFDSSGNGNGANIQHEIARKEATYSKYGLDVTTNVQYIIKRYLGSDTYNEVSKNVDDYFLVLEACAWHSAFNKKGENVGKYAASAYGWALLDKGLGLSEYGDGRNGWCDQYRLQRGCYLNKSNIHWAGLPKKPTDFGPDDWNKTYKGISYNTLLKDYGYGMIAFRMSEGLQTTCNEKLNVPHHPAPEEDGEYHIIKNYIIKHADGTYEHVKCTSKMNSCEKIMVEPEEATTGYKLKGYAVTTKNYTIDSSDYYPQDKLAIVTNKGELVWEEKVKSKLGTNKLLKVASGSKELEAKTLDLKELGGRTVFLLLIKEADAQTTCNEKQKEPHQPPDESKGTYTIIKNYVDKKGDTYKSKKCTSKTNSSPKIKVEPEEETTGYKLVAYAATTKKYTDNKTEHNPLNLLAAVNDEGELVWENAVKNELGTNKMFKGSQKNTTELKGGTFNLTKDKLKGANTIYLLLIKEEEDIQTTCDEDIPTPHKAPNESKGTYKIVKNYVTKTDDTYTDDGCYSRTNVANKIKIEDEAKTTGYHLEAWKISTKTNSPVTSVDKHSKLVWDENVPATVKKSGTTPKTVDLKEKGHEGKTVYLLLVRDKSKVQTTCDEPIPTPHPAPNESTGTYKIVKNYVTDSNGKYKDDGCFCKTKVTHQIKIEDESTTTGYTLVAWKATDSSTESVTSVAGFIFFAFF